MTDLSNNRVPFGLLTEEEQNHLRNWKGELETWTVDGWVRRQSNHFAGLGVYRTVALPEREERFMVWDSDGDAIGANSLMYANVHKRECGGTIYRITRNEDGSDPQIEVVEE